MRLLEIGCGRGHGARVLTQNLGAHGYVGLDRSKVAIQAARKLNAEAEARGIARFITGELGVADVGARPFDAILAINVNAFWTDHGEAAATCLPLLKTRGRMLLAYELPSPDGLDVKVNALEDRLHAGGFGMVESLRAPSPRTALFAMWARKG